MFYCFGSRIQSEILFLLLPGHVFVLHSALEKCVCERQSERMSLKSSVTNPTPIIHSCSTPASPPHSTMRLSLNTLPSLFGPHRCAFTALISYLTLYSAASHAREQAWGTAVTLAQDEWHVFRIRRSACGFVSVSEIFSVRVSFRHTRGHSDTTEF